MNNKKATSASNMKRFQKLGYIAIGAAIMFVLNITVPTLAANTAAVVKQLTANFTVGGNPISIFVDGEKITPKDGNGNIVDPFVVDGTTYLPVRAVSEALGKSVTWDGATASVYIGAKPGEKQYLIDVAPAYQVSNRGEYAYTEFSALKSGGVDKFSMGGVTYTNGMTLYGNRQWAVYNLNGQFTSLTAIAGHVDVSNPPAEWSYPDIYARFFADGRLVKEIAIYPGMLPIEFSIDLTGVNQLRIDGGVHGKVGIGNPVLK